MSPRSRRRSRCGKRFPRSRLYVVPDRGHVSKLYFPFRSPAVGVIRRFIAAH